MSSSPRITYTPRPGATSKGEAEALAAVYEFVLKVLADRDVGKVTGEDDHGGREQGVLEDPVEVSSERLVARPTTAEAQPQDCTATDAAAQGAS